FAVGLGLHTQRGRFTPLGGGHRYVRIRGADVELCASNARAEPLQHTHFGRARRNQMKHVNTPLLADAIDAADTLLEPHRIPGQLEVHDDPTAAMEVETLAG